MKPSVHLCTLLALALLAEGGVLAPRVRSESLRDSATMRDELQVDASNSRVLRAHFGTYGQGPRHAIFWESAGLRFRLPGGVDGIPQTGLYSYFALAGDCEATVTYELLHVPPPKGGYGSGVGLAFDVGSGFGRGAIQHVFRTAEGSGYVLHTAPGESAGEMKHVDKFMPAASMQGRIGLRRVKNELIFLSADASADPLQEVDRLPFTDRTIRAVRVFADPGGSPTAVDVRVSRIEIRAEEIALGVPQREQEAWSWRWLWAAVAVVGGALAFWIWRAYRRRHFSSIASE